MEPHIKRIKKRVAEKHSAIAKWQEYKFQAKFLLFIRICPPDRREVYRASYFYAEELNHSIFQEYDWVNLPAGSPEEIQEALGLCKYADTQLNHLLGIA